jgi:hypothetical protein
VLFAKERAAAGTDAAGTISLQEWLNARSALKGAAAPLLSVSNFSLENMEVRDCCPCPAALPATRLVQLPPSHAPLSARLRTQRHLPRTLQGVKAPANSTSVQ